VYVCLDLAVCELALEHPSYVYLFSRKRVDHRTEPWFRSGLSDVLSPDSITHEAQSLSVTSRIVLVEAENRGNIYAERNEQDRSVLRFG